MLLLQGDAADEQVDLFAQQFDLKLLSLVLLTQRRDLFSESGFQRRHHDDLEKSKTRTNFALR